MNDKSKRRIATIDNYKQVFSSVEGKRVLWDLMQEHFVIGPTFTGIDALEMAYREGQRNVVLRILNLMKIDVRKLVDIIEEQERQEQANNL